MVLGRRPRQLASFTRAKQNEQIRAPTPSPLMRLQVTCRDYVRKRRRRSSGEAAWKGRSDCAGRRKSRRLQRRTRWRAVPGAALVVSRLPSCHGDPETLLPRRSRLARSLLAMRRLPPCERRLVGLSVETIAHGDAEHPSALWGQKGVRYTGSTVLPPGTLLGQYVGVLVADDDELDCNDYTFSVNEGSDRGSHKWVVDPLHPDAPAGTLLLKYINDYRLDCVQFRRPCRLAARRLNVTVKSYRIGDSVAPESGQRDSPLSVCYFTSRSVQPGTWLAVDYGEEYWEAWNSERSLP